MEPSDIRMRIAHRLRTAADLAEAGNAGAADIVSRCHRAFALLSASATVSEAAESVRNRRGDDWTKGDADRLVDAIDAVEESLVPDGATAIDHDFAPPSVLAHVIPALSVARHSALAVPGIDRPGCLVALLAAAEALSLAAGRC